MKIKSNIGGYIITIVDQGLYSLSNFLTVVFVAKALTPYDLGLYTLIFAAVMVLGGVQTSLITGPIRVLGVNKLDNNSQYFKTQFQLQNILSASLSFLLGIGLLLFFDFEFRLAVYVALCVYFIQMYELARVLWLTKFAYKKLLITDFSVHIPKLLALFTLYYYELLSVEYCFLIIFLSCFISFVYLINEYLKLPKGKYKSKDTISSNWNYGKWLLLETVAILVSSRIYLYMIGVMLSVELAGVLGASENLLNALNVIVMGVMAFSIPVARKKYLDIGYIAWKRWLLSIGLFLVCTIGLLLILISIFAQPLMEIIYNHYYAQYAYVLPILGLAYVISTINAVLSAAFRTVEQPQKGAIAKLISAIITIIIAYPLLITWGLMGAVIGLILTQVMWMSVYLFYIMSGCLKQESVEKSVSTEAK